MMARWHIILPAILVAITTWVFLVITEGYPSGPLNILNHLDFDSCEPVYFRAKIMAVNHGKGTLTVAEKEVYRLDVGIGEHRLTTALLTLEGKPVSFTAFRVGQLVAVEGFAHPDGFVAASKIQETSSVEEETRDSKRAMKRIQKHPRSSAR
jgi:hypothetical protein